MAYYPENCLRGIPKISDITPDGRVGGTAFYPDERTAQNRTDKCMETSINWEDDDRALNVTLKLFQNGAVRLQRIEIDRINTLPASNNEIGYERAPEQNNPYHGNILFREHASKAIRKMIAGSLAMACSKIIPK